VRKGLSSCGEGFGSAERVRRLLLKLDPKMVTILSRGISMKNPITQALRYFQTTVAYRCFDHEVQRQEVAPTWLLDHLLPEDGNSKAVPSNQV